MKVIKYILYKPYFLLAINLGVSLYYFASHNTPEKTFNAIVLYALYIIIIRILFIRILRSPLLFLLNLVTFSSMIPDAVLSGYLFAFTLFNPIIAIIVAVIAMLIKPFMRRGIQHKSYTDGYGNEITQIKSLTSSVILSRKEQKTGEEEHIVITKLKKKPKKITYE